MAKITTLNPENLTILKRPIHQTYGEIAMDLGPVNNREAIETVVDAGRMITMGGPEGSKADELIHSLIQEHGWSKVLNWLNRNIQLV